MILVKELKNICARTPTQLTVAVSGPAHAIVSDPTVGRMARDMAAAQGLDPGRFRRRGLVDRRVHALAGMLYEPRLLETLERQDGRRPRPPPEADEVGEARARIGAHHREQGLV